MHVTYYFVIDEVQIIATDMNLSKVIEQTLKRIEKCVVGDSE